MDLMSLTARDLSSRCLEAFQICLTSPSADPSLSNQQASHDERFEYRLADFNLWIDGIGALAPSKASLDARLSERPIDLSLVKGNLVMLFQSLEDCLNLLEADGSLDDALKDIDSALESLVTLSLAVRRTGRRSRLHKADRLFEPEEHTELRKHLEAIVLLRPGPGPCFQDDEFQTKIKSLTPLQSHLITANLKRRNRFIQAQLHSLGLKKRSVGFELPAPEVTQQIPSPALSSPIVAGEIAAHIPSDTAEQARKPLPAPMSVTSASIPESKLQYKEPVSKRTESSPMTVITQITALARYPRPRISDNEQKMVQCPCCCQTLPVSEAKNNSRWRKHLAEDIRPYTCIFDTCPAPDVYYSSRSMLEQHFRQDHPPVWVCPLCDHGSVFPTMTEMMDHLHDSHAQDIGEDISAIISSSAQKRMGIESCPLCEVKGDADSSELIDHVLEHVHDFSLRSLPWPRPSEVDIGGEVGSFNPESGEAGAITQWLEGYEHETEDIDTTPKMSTCDYERLVIITEQIESQKQDKLGLDIGFADEHGDESAEAETDVSQLTQDTVEPVGLVEESERDRDVVYCHECSAEWYRDENGLVCPQCQSGVVEIIEPETDPRDQSLKKTSTQPRLLADSLEKARVRLEPHRDIASASKSSTREPASGFRRFTDRLFSRKKLVYIDPQDGQGAIDNLVQFLGLKQKAVENQKAWEVLFSIYHRRLDSPTKTQSMFDNFIRDVQNQESLPTLHPVSDPRSFLQVMVKFYLDPLEQLPPKDLKKPISDYFINTSHRTLLHTLSESDNAYDALKEVLYFGYRSIDLDVWNGTTNTEEVDLGENASREAKPGQTPKTLNRLFGFNRATQTLKPVAPKITVSYPTEPSVTDGFTLMTPCGFRDACQVIRESAFVNSDLPVIINLEVHADYEHQEMIVKTMKEEWRNILVDKPLEGCDPRFRLPTLEDLRGRILIRLGTTMSPSVPNPGLFDNDLFGIDRPVESHRRPGRVPIIQPLAELGVYLRREKFDAFTDMRTSSPAHLFSVQEGKVRELISTSPTKLFRHNKDYFFRVYPNSARLNTSNLDPLRFWRYGIQMAAIDRHNVDEGMMLNEGMFADESGWVLKPNGYRSLNMDNADPEEAPKKGLELNIFAFKDQEFMTSTGREIKNLASFMMVSLHINDEEKPRVPRQELNTTENESGALGYNLNFLITRAEATIIPKLCILR
ncbi:1-phosphatidylinositol-4 5-bisphosphate phosphodiesterase [Fusarium pseudocircinatum]|uniref:Phosphoinositide phospholipase C n=1 Tax=Fusarium pseudocircinatum TaxID=56676 RepID=A0A8H5KJV3_9HYPO|nr:1-phosphatidylinositol-4 5-bisphosphate phosphodiesterase [Fusarium pseudocircinatum]